MLSATSVHANGGICCACALLFFTFLFFSFFALQMDVTAACVQPLRVCSSFNRTSLTAPFFCCLSSFFLLFFPAWTLCTPAGVLILF